MGFNFDTLFLFSLFSLALLVSIQQVNATKSHSVSGPLRGRKELNKCNLFYGSWMLDYDSYPTYDSLSCPFIDAQFDCKKFRRPDQKYLQFYWKPDSCTLPR